MKMPHIIKTFSGDADQSVMEAFARYWEATMAKNQSLDSDYLDSSEFTREVYVSFMIGGTSGNAKKLCDAMLSSNMDLQMDNGGRPVRIYPESHPAYSAKSIYEWLKSNFPETPNQLLAETDMLDETKAKQKGSENALQFLQRLQPLCASANAIPALFHLYKTGLNSAYKGTLKKHMSELIATDWFRAGNPHPLATFLDERTTATQAPPGDMFYTGWQQRQQSDNQGTQPPPAPPKRCQFCKLTHAGNKCPVQCKRCGFQGHVARKCTAGKGFRKHTCSRCKTADHFYNQCPKAPSQQAPAGKPSRGDKPGQGRRQPKNDDVLAVLPADRAQSDDSSSDSDVNDDVNMTLLVTTSPPPSQTSEQDPFATWRDPARPHDQFGNTPDCDVYTCPPLGREVLKRSPYKCKHNRQADDGYVSDSSVEDMRQRRAITLAEYQARRSATAEEDSNANAEEDSDTYGDWQPDGELADAAHDEAQEWAEDEEYVDEWVEEEADTQVNGENHTE
jgi:hypothetical protein